MSKKSGASILFGFLFFVILVGGLAGGGAWFLTENRVEGYRASATLLLPAPEDGYGPIPLTRNNAAPEDGYGPIPLRQALLARVDAALGSVPRPPRQNLPAISPPDYANLFSTAAMADELKSELATAGAKGANLLTLGQIQKSMSAEAQVALQTRDNVVYRRLLTLHFNADSPELAAAGANTWAKVALEYFLNRASNEDADRQHALTRELDELHAQIQNTKERIPTAFPDAGAIQQTASDLTEAQRALSKELQSLEQHLARDEAALAMLKSYVSKAPVAVVLELSVKEAELEATLAGTRAERDHLAERISAAGLAAEEANARWREAQTYRADTKGEMEETTSLLARLKPRAAALEDALATVKRNSVRPSLQIVAPAIVPDTPAGPHRYVLVGGAAALGAILGMIIYFALLTLRVYARELDRS